MGFIKGFPCRGQKADITESKSEDENVERGNWTGRLDFLMSCISYAVGLGNIWRFPYLCYRNGGAVFLIPYLFFLALCGMPLFFLEVSYGQFASLSPVSVWRISPFFKGIGYGMVIISGIVCIYYNVIITWTIFYLIKSFYPVLPWSTCDNPWNTDACYSHHKSSGIDSIWSNDSSLVGYNDSISDLHSYVVPTVESEESVLNQSRYTSDEGFAAINQTIHSINPSIFLENDSFVKRTTPSEEFWERHVLQISEGIEDMGGVRWELFGCLVLAWVVIFLCLIKGIKSSGKVVYFTATFPYIVLIILLIRGATLPGSLIGIKFYVIPQWDKLLSLKVWGEAAMQIFYSIGAAWGALITMASYNKFHNDCYRDARIVPLINAGTSIFAGFVIFSILGFMAHETGSTIDNVIRQGPGLVFVVYPEAVAKLPVSQLWSIMFFSMLFSVGLGSQFAMFQTMSSVLLDEYEFLKQKKVLVTAVLCVLEFLLGIPCITHGGIYFLQIMDWYSSTFSLMILSLTELLVISWIYGAERFYKDIELMIGYRPCIWWKIVWCYITPVLIMFILLFSMISHTPVTYGDYSYPGWAIAIGWIMAMCSLIPLPLCMFLQLAAEKGTIKKRICKLIKPDPRWGPALEKNRENYLAGLKTPSGVAHQPPGVALQNLVHSENGEANGKKEFSL